MDKTNLDRTFLTSKKAKKFLRLFLPSSINNSVWADNQAVFNLLRIHEAENKSQRLHCFAKAHLAVDKGLELLISETKCKEAR